MIHYVFCILSLLVIFMTQQTQTQITGDLTQLATSLQYASEIANYSGSDATNITFLSFSAAFDRIITPRTSARIIATLPYQAFHEAGVYNRKTNSLYVSSNREQETNSFNVTIINLADYSVSSKTYDGLPSPNGGTAYSPPDQLDQTPPYIVFAEQGTLTSPAGIVQLDPFTNTTTPLLTSFLGRNFSSLNDIRQNYITGDLYFTDPYYGFLQGFRPKPTLPAQVYRFSPATGRVSAVADQFVQTNGLEFSPDFRTLYVTDTGAVGTEVPDFTRPATIYAFDVTDNQLSNRRLFAYPASNGTGIPDGIHSDVEGNVWVAVGGEGGDGIQVFNSKGDLIGKILVPGGEEGEGAGGVSNFAFLSEGRLIIFNERRAWLVEGLNAQGREVAKDFGL